ncbi:MAG: HAMP domain-containing histidine kinase, partial [Proteobacteria bacterium]
LSGVRYTFGSAFYTQIALHTAILFVVAASGMLLCRPRQGLMAIAFSPGIAGRICRRLLAAGILIPPLTNYLALQGVKAGLYDDDFGVLIRVVSNVVFFTWVALHTSTRLYQAEKMREGAEEERGRVMNALERAVRARDELLSVCSHEMRTPLTSMRLANQLVERQIAKGDPRAFEPEQITRTVKTSSVQINRLMKLIEEMLDFSRITEGRLKITPQPTELKALLENVVAQVTPELNASKCELSFTHPSEVHGLWDQFRIEQVIINLLGNSMKYAKGCRIQLALSETPASALITVKDEGCGVAQENLSRVFEPYVRAESVMHVTGLGLGLYISKQIVEGHGGRIWMESQVGQGTAVHVELPKQPALSLTLPT